MVLSLSVTLCLSLSLSQLLSPLCLNVFDLCLRPVLHPNAHPMPTSLGFSRSCGFHRRSKLWVSLGFIVEAAIAFLSPLLWFSADQTHPPQTHFFSANQTHADTVLLIEAQLYDWWFFILFVIGDFVWSGLRKKIGDFGWWFYFFLIFFFLLWTGGSGDDGGGGGGGGCDCGWW